MRCPFCSADDDRVVDSRLTDDGTAIRRRRQCNECEKRFTTYERVEDEDSLRVIKRDGTIELFDRGKIMRGLLRACEKRPVRSEDLEGIANRIQQDLLKEGKREVESESIGNRVIEALKDVDGVAYVRFASVYRQFKDIEDFMSELRNVIGEGRGATAGDT